MLAYFKKFETSLNLKKSLTKQSVTQVFIVFVILEITLWNKKL